MVPRLQAWSVGVGESPTLGGHQAPFHGEVLFPKISTSVLNFRQLSLMQVAMLIMHLGKLVSVVMGSSYCKRMSWVLSA